MSPERTPWFRYPDPAESHALPAATGPAARRPFGTTWWGKAWLDALTQRARLDPNRLGRGRSYARRGSVLTHTVEPGVVSAEVQGSRPQPYAVTVRVRAFTDADWDAVLDVMAAQLGRVAALLDGELPPEVVDDVAAAGLDLLPGSGELVLSCSCPDFANPCKHAAAVCFVIADSFDDDPFEVLQLRGRGRTDLLAALRARRTTGGPAPAAVTAPRGLVARDAYRREPAALPPIPLPPARPGIPSALLALEPPDGIDARALATLAMDAVGRAWELASGDGDGGLALTRDEDLARRAAGLLGTPDLADLAHRAGITARVLAAWGVAWREGGSGGLAVARDPATISGDRVDPGRMEEARDALTASRPDTSVVVRGNRATSGRVQLRLGPDTLWYLFTKQFDGWMLAAPPSPDPTALLAR